MGGKKKERQPPVGDCRSCSTRDVRIYKPNLVCPARRRDTEDGEVVIYLGRSSPIVSSGLPAPSPISGGRRVTSVPTSVGTRRDLALHPVGFAWPVSSPRPPVRSYRTLSPLIPKAFGTGLLSVARAFHTAPRQNGVLPGPVRCGLPVRKHGPCGVRTFLTAEGQRHRCADASCTGPIDGATARSARHTVNAQTPIKVRGRRPGRPPVQ